MSYSMTERSVDRRRCLPGSIVRLTSCLLVLWLVVPAAAELRAHDNRADGDPSNDWIEGLANADDEACCGNNDCRPLLPGALQSTPGSGLSVEIDHRLYEVPERSLLRDSSPDGRAWVCPKFKSMSGGYSYRIEGIRCLLLPPMI